MKTVSFEYPVGLYEFYAEVDEGSTETITVYLDDQYDTSDWVYRKYSSTTGQYVDISDDITYATAAVDGDTVTTISYDVVDNGPLDQDDRLGFILDPAGPGEPMSEDGDESSESSGISSGIRLSDRSNSSNTAVPGNVGSIVAIDNNISFIQPDFNDPVDVRNLTIFLNQYQGESLPIDSRYGSADEAAVKRFQTKYQREILDIWNLTEATGYVGITTRLKVNFLIKSESASCPAFTEYNGGLDGVFRSPEVIKTKEILRDLGMYNRSMDDFWNPHTNDAMILFQETFREVMLDPWDISEGTGYKYKTTNKFLNYLAGCDTGPIELEGVGVYEGL